MNVIRVQNISICERVYGSVFWSLKSFRRGLNSDKKRIIRFSRTHWMSRYWCAFAFRTSETKLEAVYHRACRSNFLLLSFFSLFSCSKQFYFAHCYFARCHFSSAFICPYIARLKSDKLARVKAICMYVMQFVLLVHSNSKVYHSCYNNVKVCFPLCFAWYAYLIKYFTHI